MRRKSTDEQIRRSAAAARAVMGGEFDALGEAPATTRRNRSGDREDTLLDNYFKRIDPQVAASFTAPQRQAIRTMMGLRGTPHHAVDFRRSIVLGRARYYLVFLLGRERRSLARLHRERLDSGTGSLIRYFMLAILLLLPIAGLVYGLKTAGLDVLASGGLPF